MVPHRAVAYAVYAYGANRDPRGRFPPGWGRVTGLIAEGQLRLTSPGAGATVFYRSVATDVLDAYYERQGFQLVYARMQRLKD